MKYTVVVYILSFIFFILVCSSAVIYCKPSVPIVNELQHFPGAQYKNYDYGLIQGSIQTLVQKLLRDRLNF